MAITTDKSSQLCKRLMSLGYSCRKRQRMYGEEFDLTSNPVPHENGFAVEAVSRKSGSSRRLRIPLSVVEMIMKDLASEAAAD